MEKRDYAQVSTSADIPKQDHFDRVFNPAVSKPLRKVWVRPELAFFLESIYQPEFQNTVDFVRKSDPERTIAIEKQQQMRTGRIKTLLKKDVQRHRRKTLADLVFVAREQQLDPELPPELPLLDETMFPRSASPTRSTAESPTKDL
jgi:hypothetical protein